MTRVGFAIALLALAACGDMQFSAMSPPPPGATAELDDEDGAQSITLSRGAALAFECTHTLEGTCGAGTIASADESIAAAMVGYADTLAPLYAGGSQPRSVFVVVGKRVGKTELELATDVGDATLTVEVVD